MLLGSLAYSLHARQIPKRLYDGRKEAEMSRLQRNMNQMAQAELRSNMERQTVQDGPAAIGFSKPICSSGRALPQFGRYIDLDGIITTRANGFLRPIDERIADYTHPCLLRNRTGDSSVTAKMAKSWVSTVVKRRQLSQHKNSAADLYLDKLRETESTLARIYAETKWYGVTFDFSPCISALNQIYARDNAYQWDGIKQQKGKNQRKYADWFQQRFDMIERTLHDALDKIDPRHINEYSLWQMSHAEEYAARKKAIEEEARTRNILAATQELDTRARDMEKRAKESAERANAAIQRAEEAARAASMRAAQAERDAEEAMRRTEWLQREADDLEHKLRMRGIDIW